MAKRSNNNQSDFFLIIDGQLHFYTGLYTPTENPFGSIVSNTATINVELKKGQVVKVKNHGSDRIFGKYYGPGFLYSYLYSFFSGYMIAAL